MIAFNYDFAHAGSEDVTKDLTQDFNFVAAGDFGCGHEANRTIGGMVNKDPENVIALGDLSYNKSGDCWINSIMPLDEPGRVKISVEDLTRAHNNKNID